MLPNIADQFYPHDLFAIREGDRLIIRFGTDAQNPQPERESVEFDLSGEKLDLL